jgi:LysR family transcriptional regulator for metE and metH
MDDIEIKHLRLIKTISETRNLTKAARKLFVSQPALSRQLKDIEQRLGVDLFHRTKKSMILTKMGKKLLLTADSVLQELDRTQREIAKTVCGEQGTFKIGMNCIFSYQWLPGIIATFQKLYPTIEIEISDADRIVKQLISKEVDLIITSYAKNHEEIEYKMLFEGEIVVIMAPDHPWQNKKTLTEKDFQGKNIISIFDKTRDPFYQYLAATGIEIATFMKIDQPGAVIELVKAGLGVSIFPKWAVRSCLERGELKACALTQYGMRLGWMAAYRKHDNLPAFQEELLRLIINHPP